MAQQAEHRWTWIETSARVGSLLLALALGFGSLVRLFLHPHLDGWTVAGAVGAVRLALGQLNRLGDPPGSDGLVSVLREWLLHRLGE